MLVNVTTTSNRALVESSEYFISCRKKLHLA